MKGGRREKEFLIVYEAHMDAVFRHCYFRVFNRDRAKEIMQEAFTRVWKVMKEGQEVKNIRALVYRVAENLIIDESRKKKSPSLEEMQEKGFDPHAKAPPADVIEIKRMQEAVQHIDPIYREAVWMRYVDDLSPKEIAEVTGESQNVISVRIYRGLKQLRAKLSHL